MVETMNEGKDKYNKKKMNDEGVNVSEQQFIKLINMGLDDVPIQYLKSNIEFYKPRINDGYLYFQYYSMLVNELEKREKVAQ